MSDRIQTIPVVTQDYVSVCHGNAMIDTYVTEPAAGVRPTTGMLLLIHGWGNDGSQAYREDSIEFADRFDLVVTRIEYRHSGREERNPAGLGYQIPYDFSKLQAIDCLRAATATLARYPQIDRTRLLLWGGSQGGHLGTQCLIFAPHLWAAAVLTCGVYLPMTAVETAKLGFSMDLRATPGVGFAEAALGPGGSFSPAEEDIRSPIRNAELMPPSVPMVLIHGTHDDVVDIKHSIFFYARLLGLGRPARFYAVENGDHGLVWATFKDEDTRLKATLKYAADDLGNARRRDVTTHPAEPVKIQVRGGVFEVTYPAEGPTLRWLPDATS